MKFEMPSPADLREGRGRSRSGSGKAVANGRKCVGVLLHDEVQQNALRVEKAFGALPDPFGKQGDRVGFPMPFGGFGLRLGTH